MINIHCPAPDFELPDLNGNLRRLSAYRGKIVIVNFWSRECPHSERTDKALMAMFVQWRDNVVMLSVASNRNETLAAIKNSARERNLPVVLVDADSAVANLYEAQTTPHVFVIDREGVLRYRGAIDDVAFRRRVPSRFFWTRRWKPCWRAGCLKFQKRSFMGVPLCVKFDRIKL